MNPELLHTDAPRPQPGLRHLVLAGSGAAHLWLLAQLAQSRPADLNITLVASSTLAMPAALLPDWVAGTVDLDLNGLRPADLAQACQAKVIATPCRRLDATARVLELSDSSLLPFDWLSMDTEAHMARAGMEALMPGARSHALFVHPAAQFAQLWPQVLGLANRRPIHVALVGGEMLGLQLALAMAHALRAAAPQHASRLSWVTPESLTDLLPLKALRAKVQARLHRLDVTVLQTTCVGFEPGAVRLGNGASLQCDAPVLAGPVGMPGWLEGSQLACDGRGRVKVDRHARSLSHPHVFAVNDAAAHESGAQAGPGDLDPSAEARRLLHSLQDGWREGGHRSLARLFALPEVRTLAGGPGHALAVWHGMVASGGWIAAWRRARARRFLQLLH